ncbi:BnaA01g24100D [Brassica napus]|uniref:BnaA01g24100D protein n=4 Tax=Brassica TaxID=3705 RepID=A0A078HCJ5_BRANA|nr:BnaA01g24100D [Brassica napus]VDC76817.1 unnamed protein product [Brassica rapa]
MADILVNLTEMGRLVSEGYVLTVLAPNDEAKAKVKFYTLRGFVGRGMFNN